MSQMLLLNADDLAKRTIILGNTDVDKLTSAIYIAQTNDIKRILTPTLYEKIVLDYSGDTLTGTYEIIYEQFVVDMLSYFSASEYLATGAYFVNNTGINRMVPEFGTSVDISEATYLSEHYRSLGCAIELVFKDFIKNNPVPEYVVNCKDTGHSSFGMPWLL